MSAQETQWFCAFHEGPHSHHSARIDCARCSNSVCLAGVGSPSARLCFECTKHNIGTETAEFEFKRVDLSAPEPRPTRNDLPNIVDLVKADMDKRAEYGLAHYGAKLQPHNGRRALIDAYQEALDLAQFLRQAIYEEYGE